jgi:hypothetical protein
MIGQARRGGAGFVGGDGGSGSGGATLVVEEEDSAWVLVEVPTPAGRLRLTRREAAIGCALVVFAIMLNVRIVDGAEANRCLAILVLSTILWATEVSKRCDVYLPGFMIMCCLGDPIIRHIHIGSSITRAFAGHPFARRTKFVEPSSGYCVSCKPCTLYLAVTPFFSSGSSFQQCSHRRLCSSSVDSRSRLR